MTWLPACAPYAPVAAWFPVPRYGDIQRGRCGYCGEVTIQHFMPAGVFIRGLICCKCSRCTGVFTVDGP